MDKLTDALTAIAMLFVASVIIMLSWNWLAPYLFGLREINYWQAFMLLFSCRIAFGSWSSE